MEDPQALIAEIRNKNLPIIIYGAGIVGKVLLSICEEKGLSVECFCDTNIKVSQGRFCNKEVIYAPDLRKKYKDALFIISAAAIKNVVELLDDLGFSNWYAGSFLLKGLDVTWRRFGPAIDYTKYTIETCIICHNAYLDSSKLFLRSIDLIITERCSLRCKDCSNLMQYYTSPRDSDTGRLLESIAVFFKVFDDVMEFRVIGGDVFMNKDWPLIVKRLTLEPKARRVVLYTNGTILPSEESIPFLINEKALVVATDYGILSRKLAELIQIFEKNKIFYYILKVKDWLDCSLIMPHNRSIEQKQQLFKFCCAKNMATLSDGKLFRCPYSANAARLAAVPDYRSDYIDLFQEPLNAAGICETKNKVKRYLLQKDYLETCDYCNGRPLSGSEVLPAIQTAKPLRYHKYIA